MPDSGAPNPEQGPQDAAGRLSRGSLAGAVAVARSFLGRPRLAWALVAVAVVAAGAAASVIGARAIARSDARGARQTFAADASAIAAGTRGSLQREEDLVTGAATFFGSNPESTALSFRAWAGFAHALGRHPELQRMSLVAAVRAADVGTFQARTGAGLTPAAASTLDIVPPGTRPVYCLSVGEVTRRSEPLPAGLDYCAREPGLLSSRASGRRSVRSSAGEGSLDVLVPVYRGGTTPSTRTGREAAFVGWLREVVDPGVIVAQALQGHPDGAARLRYRAHGSHASFTGGAPAAGAQSKTFDLHGGWTLRVSGPQASATVLDNGDARALLVAGCLLSLLAGLLVLLGGGGRGAAPARTRPVPSEDLYDALTGLPNRALTLDRAERTVARASRQPGMLAGALLIDIDWFKDVNEKLGRAAGDQLLRTVSERLQAVVRAEDSIGRVGGDEFVVLVESAARGARLDSLARRIIEALHKPVDLEDFGPSFFLTASIGVAFGRYTAADDLLRDAKLALVAAKAAGKDRYTLFNANMRSVIEDRGVLEAELSAALQDRQFQLLYHPIYDLRTNEVVTLEALIRWRHPKQGLLAPADFVPLAEETGLIVPIGRWALEEACNRGAAWDVAGNRVGVAVKIAARQLHRDGFATDVRRALQQSGIDPALLTLEIAETTMMDDIEAAETRIGEVKGLGVRIAIDDFGSGYAYRSDLQRMPLDFLKVDRSSLATSDDEDYRSWLLEAILLFGRDLALTVIAKGVETREQADALKAMGCTLAQGFFMGEPAAADTVGKLFARAAAPAPADPAPGPGTALD